MARRWMLVGLALVAAGCGDKDAEDTGDGAAASEGETYPDQCYEFVDKALSCFETAGIDPDSRGLTQDYCLAYDMSDPTFQDWFACHVEKLADIDCTADADEVIHEIGILPNRCGQGV